MIFTINKLENIRNSSRLFLTQSFEKIPSQKKLANSPTMNFNRNMEAETQD